MEEAEELRPKPAAPVYPVFQDPWEFSKPLIYRLYIEERRKLSEVMNTVQRENNFTASVSMYKKKLRQWKFQTDRKGWTKRRAIRETPTSKSELRKATAMVRYSGPRQSTTRSLPTEWQDQQLSLSFTCDEIRRRYKLVLPPDFLRITSINGPSRDPLSFPTPPASLNFTQCFVNGLEVLHSGGKASTAGALFEKAFALIEPLVRSTYVTDFLWIIESFQAGVFFRRPELVQMMLSQFWKMAVKIHGPTDPLAVLVSFLMRTPHKGEAMALCAQAWGDTVDHIMGRYDESALLNRVRVLKVKAHNPATPPNTTLPEWEQVIQDCRDSPHKRSLERLSPVQYYADTLMEVMGDNLRAEKVLEEGVVKLKLVTPEDKLPMPYTWSLVGGTEMHARAAAAQDKDGVAEASFRLSVLKGRELLGKDNPLTMHCQQSFAAWLTERGRQDEVDKIQAEMDAELREFMLEEKS